MKRLIVGFLLAALQLATLTALKAQDTATTPPDSVKVELTKEKIYDDVKHAITAIADGLSVGAEHVYGILVKQQVVYAISELTVIIFFSGLSVYLLSRSCTIYRRKAAYNKNYDFGDEGEEVAMLVPGLLIASIVLISIVIEASDIITGLVNPEYDAIQEILGMIKKI